MERDVRGIVETNASSVALVTSHVRFRPDSQTELTEPVKMSAVVVRADGYLVTVEGGVERADPIFVEIPGRAKLTAKFVAADPVSGLAVLKVEAEDLDAAEWDEEDSVPGSAAVLLGNAFGLQGSCGVGWIAGRGRSVRVEERELRDMLQVSVPVAPGEAGGLVVGSSGRAIGLIHSVFSPEGDGLSGGWLEWLRAGMLGPAGAANSGATFAIPARIVRLVADRLIRDGAVRRGWIGITAGPGSGEGCEVRKVQSNGPAEQAGLRRGDVIVSYDGRRVEGVEDLSWSVMREESVRRVRVRYLREGREHEAELEVQVRTSDGK